MSAVVNRIEEISQEGFCRRHGGDWLGYGTKQGIMHKCKNMKPFHFYRIIFNLHL